MLKDMEQKRRKEPWDPKRFALDPYLMLDKKMEDWTGTEEGKFAHSIKIPNPLPEDSGYKPGMTQQEYFEHLCKTEAGEFIFKTADNVESIFQMRPRPFYKGSDGAHLYAVEDPYGFYAPEVEDPAFSFVSPKAHLYKQLELPIGGLREYDAAEKVNRHHSLYAAPRVDSRISRFFGREDGLWQSMPVTVEIGERWGDLQAKLEKKGKPMPTIDGLIAATALHHRLTVVTRNTKDMEASGASLLNPWAN